MDAKTQESIVQSHGHLISQKPSHQIDLKGKCNAEDSGPPSPSSGPLSNFGQVAPGIYRSAFPHAGNMAHLRSLGLKSVLTLVKTLHSQEFLEYTDEEGINHFSMIVPAHKTESSFIPEEILFATLKIILNPANYPLLIHCNKGKHRTGCMVACYRKLKGWADSDIIAEYRQFAGDKNRPFDERFIATFNTDDARLILDGVDMPYFPLPPSPIRMRLGSPPPAFPVPWSFQAKALLVLPDDPADSLPTPPPSDKSEVGDDDDAAWPSPRDASPERWLSMVWSRLMGFSG